MPNWGHPPGRRSQASQGAVLQRQKGVPELANPRFCARPGPGGRLHYIRVEAGRTESRGRSDGKREEAPWLRKAPADVQAAQRHLWLQREGLPVDTQLLLCSLSSIDLPFPSRLILTQLLLKRSGGHGDGTCRGAED